MDIETAKIILSNLRERIEPTTDGRYRLEGIITKKELEALDFLISGLLPLDPLNKVLQQPTQTNQHSVNLAGQHAKASIPAELEADVTLDLSSLELPESSSEFRVCLDFGTAMSKATFIKDNQGTDFEDITVLNLGIPGDQEQVDEIMLVSSLFIDDNSKIWFGQHAVERSQNTERPRIDNIKRWLSEGNLNSTVTPEHNPSTHSITYEDLVLAYLAFFTWATNEALANDVNDIKIPSNFRRRFAMPCFPRANAELIQHKLKSMLGEAQVLADTFKNDIHNGLDLGRFLFAIKKLRANKHTYHFIEKNITEPLGVAGSILSWRSSIDSLALVVDIGAGTSDFSLYRLKVTEDNNSTAFEVENSARGITEAGNHLDQLLKAFILGRAKIDSTHPQFMNIAYDLERNIRNHKEALFNTGAAYIPLFHGESVDILLTDFVANDAVQAFEASLKQTMINILGKVDKEFINWVQSHPSRYLTIVLTGGGAALPMAKNLATNAIQVNGTPVRVALARSFPAWLQEDYPDLEDRYPRIAVSLGGARKNLIQSGGVATTTGSGLGGYVLESFPTKGN